MASNLKFGLWMFHELLKRQKKFDLQSFGCPSHKCIVLLLESLSSKCAKFYTVPASNSRDHLTRSLRYCLFAPLIYGFYSACTFCLWWITHSTQRVCKLREVRV